MTTSYGLVTCNLAGPHLRFPVLPFANPWCPQIQSVSDTPMGVFGIKPASMVGHSVAEYIDVLSPLRSKLPEILKQMLAVVGRGAWEPLVACALRPGGCDL